ncbi:hypothetical protein [Breznakiella homolactica]|uniref:Uncharacterized protein n=1 Tax=Breznakiella homolactica TaxID=2798577 RepID=A0A7T8BAU6_9SPIR|nr:hypothetical protein [Breznakiella homolactica]QQO08523.1 hypothetical protein JFL75_16535 [Breznakiella homolactica]
MKKIVAVCLLGLTIGTVGLFADHGSGFAIGPVVSGGGGTGGAGGTVGATFKIPSLPVFWAAKLRFNSDGLGIGVTGDYYFIDRNLVQDGNFNLDWYIGGGAYVNMGFYDDFFLSLGARLPIGLSWHIANPFELYLAVVPSLGIEVTPDIDFPDFDIGAELGFRFWFD